MRFLVDFQLDGFGKHPICFHGPHISGAAVCCPLVPVAIAGPIKLPLIVASAAKQPTAHFTRLPQVHYSKLCMFISQLEALYVYSHLPCMQFCRDVGKSVISPIMHPHGSFIDLELHVISHAVPGRWAVPGRGCGP